MKEQSDSPRARRLRASRLVRIACASVLGTFSITCALAQSVERPSVTAGDTWTYRDTREGPTLGWNQTRDDVVVSRVTSSSIYFVTKATGSAQTGRERFATQEWGVVRDVNGQETVVNRPLAFPLAPGKTWEVEFTEQNPSPTLKWSRSNRKYTAVGFETVEVPAGKFNALKIEVEGRWTAELAPAQTVVQAARTSESGATATSTINKTIPQTVSGRYVSLYWYAPEVKRFVKNVEETYDNKGMLAERVTGELESYKLAK